MKRTLLNVLLLTAGLAAVATSQSSEPWTATLRGSLLIPTGALGDLFRPGGGFAIGVGQRTSSEMVWEGVLDVARFSRPNAERLYHDSLSLGLEWIGVGVQATYRPFGGEGLLGGSLDPFVAGGAMMTRWLYDRGGLAADTSGSVVVAPFRQQDWSLALSVGAGCEVYVMDQVSVYGGISYRLVIGDIWPTLALRVEGASGFTMIDASAGLRVWF